MAITIGGLRWDVSINTASATTALTRLDKLTGQFGNRLRQTSTLFGGLGNNFGKFNSQVQVTSRSFDGLTKSLIRYNREGRNANKTTRDLNGNLSTTSVETDKFTKSLGSLSATFAGITAVTAGFGGAIANFAKDSALLAARVENLGTVLQNVGNNIGLNAAQINNLETGVRRLGITQRSARQSLTQLAQANIDLGRSFELTRVAQDAAVIAGINSSEAFNRLVVSIQRNDVRLLRNLGIVINLRQAYQEFAQQNNRTAASLSAVEKRQIVLNQVLERGRTIQGTYESSLNDTFKQLTSLNRVIEDATVTFGKQFQPVLAFATKGATEFFTSIRDGTSFFNARTLAVLAAGVAAFGAFAAVVTTVTAAVLAFNAAVALGPLGVVAAALAVVGVGIAALTASYVDAQLEIAAFNQNLEDQEELARNQVQALSDLEDELQSLRDLSRGRSPIDGTIQEFLALEEALESGRNTIVEFSTAQRLTGQDIERLRTLVDRLSASFPELEEKLRSALDDPAPTSALENLIAREIPTAFLTATKRVEAFEAQLQSATKEFERAFATAQGVASEQSQVLTQFIRVQDTATGSARDFRDEQEATGVILEDLNTIRERGVDGIREVTVRNDELVRTNRRLAAALEEVVEAEGRLNQARIAQLTQQAQLFRQAVGAQSQQNQRALNSLQSLERARLRLFQGTNLSVLEDFRSTTDALSEVNLQSEQELTEQAALFARSRRQIREEEQRRALRDLEIERARELQEVGDDAEARLAIQERFGERQDKIRDEFSKRAQADFEFQRQGLRDLQAAQENVANARAQALANLEKSFEQNRVALEALQQAELLEAENISPALINQRKKFIEETQKLEGANRELEDAIDQLLNKLRGLGVEEESILALTRQGLFSPEFFQNLDDAGRATVLQLQKFQEGLESNQQVIEARRQIAADKFERQRQKELDAIAKQEEELQRKILQLTEEGRLRLEESTVKGVEGRLKALRRGGEQVDRLIRDVGRDLDFGDVPGVESFLGQIDKFRDAFSKATSPEQARRLRNLFPRVVNDTVADLANRLRDAKDALEDFRAAGEGRGEVRDEVAARRRELTEAGVTGVAFQQDILKLQRRLEERRKRRKQELEDEVSNIEKGIDQVRTRGQQFVEETDELSKQAGVSKEINFLEETRLQLVKEQTAEYNTQLQTLQKQRALFEGATIEAGLPDLQNLPQIPARTPSVPIASPTPPAPQSLNLGGQAVSTDAEGLRKKILAEQKKQAEQDQSTVEFLEQLLESQKVRTRRGESRSQLEQRLLAEAKAGRRRFDQVRSAGKR